MPITTQVKLSFIRQWAADDQSADSEEVDHIFALLTLGKGSTEQSSHEDNPQDRQKTPKKKRTRELPAAPVAPILKSLGAASVADILDYIRQNGGTPPPKTQEDAERWILRSLQRQGKNVVMQPDGRYSWWNYRPQLNLINSPK